jgi:hypothetical protein
MFSPRQTVLPDRVANSTAAMINSVCAGFNPTGQQRREQGRTERDAKIRLCLQDALKLLAERIAIHSSRREP